MQQQHDIQPHRKRNVSFERIRVLPTDKKQKLNHTQENASQQTNSGLCKQLNNISILRMEPAATKLHRARQKPKCIIRTDTRFDNGQETED